MGLKKALKIIEAQMEIIDNQQKVNENQQQVMDFLDVRGFFTQRPRLINYLRGNSC